MESNNDEYVKIKRSQLDELTKQLNELRETGQEQAVAIRAAYEVMMFFKNMIPTGENGEIDVDPMMLMDLMQDTSKFKPIMQQLAIVQQYMQTYEQKNIRVLSKQQ